MFEFSILPDEVEAERAIVGTLILDSKYLPIAIDSIKDDRFFYDSRNRIIFRTMVDMFNNGESIDFITILGNLKVDNTQKQDFRKYMLELSNIVPHMSNFEYYLEIADNSFKRREIVNIAHDILQKSLSQDKTNDILDHAESEIFNLKLSNNSRKPKHISEICHEYCDWLGKTNSKDSYKFVGIPTKFNRLDDCLGGLGKSNLILLAARPGMGKTSFALNIAKNTSRKFRTLIFSLEMSRQQLVSKLLSSESLVDSSTLSRGVIKEGSWGDIAEAADRLSGHKLFMDDTAGITVNEIKAKTILLKDIDLIIIDYLQLISKGKRTYSQARNEEITEITRNLKIMAKELDIPVVCLSQLSRACEQRDNHRPRLSDLRDSGSIEQDADQVIMLYRPGYYEGKYDPKECECIVAKNRHGTVETILFEWDQRINVFLEKK